MSHAEATQLAGVVLAGIGLRIGAALYFGNEIGNSMPGVADQLSYHTLASRVVEGHGFTFATGWWPATPAGEPTAHWSFLYTLAISGLYAVFGPQPLVVRLLQALVVGALHPYLSWRLGRRLFGPRVAVACGLVGAAYPYFVYYGAALMTEALYMVGILLIVNCALRVGDDPPRSDRESYGPWVWLGLATAGTVLLRQVFLLCMPLVLAWIVARRINAGRAIGLNTGQVLRALTPRAAVSIALLVICVMPVTIRNYQAFGRFVPINTNAGFAFFWGNHPVHGDRYMPLLPGDGSEYGRLIPDEIRGLNEAELDQALLVRGFQFVADDPLRYVRLSAGRFREYFKFWPSAESGTVSNIIRVGSFGLALPLMLWGIALAFTGRAPGAMSDRGALLLPIVVAIGYAGLHVLTWALVRYRLPVDALLAPFTAASAVWVFDRARRVWWPLRVDYLPSRVS